MADDNDLTSIPAVVLAGGINDEAMLAATGVENRALVELTPKRTMLSYVIAAMVDSKSVGHIVTVGDVPASDDYERLPTGPTFLDNLIRGVYSLPVWSPKVLVVTSDIPFINADAVDDFVSRAIASGDDFCYPIIPMSTYRREFAGMKRTTLKLAEGEFTGGNIMLVNASYVRDHQQTILAAYSARKDVLELGRMLGWGLLLRVIFSQTISPKLLDIRSIEIGVAKLLGHGASARAIITEYASLGTDVDKPEDVVEARRILSERV